MEKSAFDDIVFLTDDYYSPPTFTDFLHKKKESISRNSFYVTTKREEVVTIDTETFWDKNSLIEVEADGLESCKNFLQNNFRGQYANIYLNVPIMNVLFRRGVVRKYAI